MGMVSSVGYDLDTSCASIRAGLRRPTEWMGYETPSASLEGAPIVVHRLDGLTDGFYFVGRWVRLAQLCIQDLVKRHLSAENLADFLKHTGVLVAAPILNQERYLMPDAIDPEMIKTALSEVLFEAEAFHLQPDLMSFFPGGPAGLSPALSHAAKELEERRFERAILVGVDSYCDAASISWASERNRIKTDDQPFGFAPGEAAACLMVENHAKAAKRGAAIIGHIEAFATDGDKEIPTGGGRGTAITKVYRKCFDPDRQPLMTMITDLNGEEWRAREFGYFLQRIEKGDPGYVIEAPCESLGDTGAGQRGGRRLHGLPGLSKGLCPV